MKISDFVIRLGFDATEFGKGMKNAKSSLGGFKSEVLQLSAVLGSAFGMHQLTFGFSKQNNELRQLSALYGETTERIYGLNEAAKSVGAQDGEIISSLTKLASARAEFSKLGKIGIFQDLALIGVDFDKINAAKTEVEAMYVLADQISKLDQKNKIIAANILGLTPQTMALLSTGGEAMKNLSEQYQEVRVHTDAMADSSAKFLAQWNLLEQVIGARADAVSRPLIDGLTHIIECVNELILANHELIDNFTGGTVQKIVDFFNSVNNLELKSKELSFYHSEDALNENDMKSKNIYSIPSNLNDKTNANQNQTIKTDTEDAFSNNFDIQSFTKQPKYNDSNNKTTQTKPADKTINTTANINVVVNDNVIANVVAELVNGQLTSTISDSLILEDR